MSTPRATGEEPAPRDRHTTYLAVVVIEALTIVALWIFGSYFSG